MKVPFLDLKIQHDQIRDEIGKALLQVQESCAFSGGPFVERFEEDFSSFCNCSFAIGVGSGTEALFLALLGMEIGQGDEVITVPNTFFATAEAISLTGARPIFVDVDEQSFTMDPTLLEAAITLRTKAVIPVHLYGQMADMDPIMEICNKHKIMVIEDACQAHGAEYKGRKAGSIGDAGCFSFYPGKNLGAFGEAGSVVTNNHSLNKTIRQLRDHGQDKKYQHQLIGLNSRMDGIQGAVLSVKLKYLHEWNTSRRKNAEKYTKLLGGIDGISVPNINDNHQHVYHIYPIHVQRRDALLSSLAHHDIHCGIHYPIPIHLQKPYRDVNQFSIGEFRVSEKNAAQQLSLPMFPELTEEQINHVAGEVKRFVEQ